MQLQILFLDFSSYETKIFRNNFGLRCDTFFEFSFSSMYHRSYFVSSLVYSRRLDSLSISRVERIHARYVLLLFLIASCVRLLMGKHPLFFQDGLPDVGCFGTKFSFCLISIDFRESNLSSINVCSFNAVQVRKLYIHPCVASYTYIHVSQAIHTSVCRKLYIHPCVASYTYIHVSQAIHTSVCRKLYIHPCGIL